MTAAAAEAAEESNRRRSRPMVANLACVLRAFSPTATASPSIQSSCCPHKELAPRKTFRPEPPLSPRVGFESDGTPTRAGPNSAVIRRNPPEWRDLQAAALPGQQ